MSSFITTAKISSLIETIIKESEDFIILISPFLQIHSRLKKLIERKLKTSKVSICFVCRNNIPLDEKIWIQTLDSKVTIVFHDNLHAKCYLNEKSAIVTSINLYEYSMINNIEFGVHFTLSNDLNNYYEIIEETNSLIIHSDFWSRKNSSLIEVDIIELVKSINADNLLLVEDEEGFIYITLKGGSEEISIKKGSEIILKKDGKLRIKELIDNYKIYKFEGLSEIEYKFGF
jgi:hypothetical protein